MNNLDKKSIKIACTGGSGFIGANFIKYLNNQGYTNIDIYEKLDKLSNKWQNLADLVFNNIYDSEFLLREDISNSYNWIVLLGADSSTTTSNFRQTLYDNVEYPQKVINNVTNVWESKCSKIIFASSAATYGLSKCFIERTTDIKPSNFYGLTKLMVDRFIEQKIQELDNHKDENKCFSYPDIYSFRFFNVYGNKEEHKAEVNMTSPVSRFLSSKPPFVLFKSASCYYKNEDMARDFINVMDVSDVIFWSLTNPVISSIYNLGTGVATSWQELLKIVCEIKKLDFNSHVKYVDMPENIRGHYQYKTCADITKLRAAGYKKEFLDIKNGIREMLNLDIKKDAKSDE